MDLIVSQRSLFITKLISNVTISVQESGAECSRKVAAACRMKSSFVRKRDFAKDVMIRAILVHSSISAKLVILQAKSIIDPSTLLFHSFEGTTGVSVYTYHEGSYWMNQSLEILNIRQTLQGFMTGLQVFPERRLIKGNG